MKSAIYCVLIFLVLDFGVTSAHAVEAVEAIEDKCGGIDMSYAAQGFAVSEDETWPYYLPSFSLDKAVPVDGVHMPELRLVERTMAFYSNELLKSRVDANNKMNCVAETMPILLEDILHMSRGATVVNEYSRSYGDVCRRAVDQDGNVHDGCVLEHDIELMKITGKPGNLLQILETSVTSTDGKSHSWKVVVKFNFEVTYEKKTFLQSMRHSEFLDGRVYKMQR